MTMNHQIHANEQWRPVAYVTLRDQAARERIAGVLERAGWAVIAKPTGFHLIQAIAGVVEGDRVWLRPGLIVIDARSHGCAGTTIAAGLRELGIKIPIVLIAAAGEALPVSSDDTLRIADSASADAVVADLARVAYLPAVCSRGGASEQQRAG
jgi:CheY-like chemotaxis protein